MGRNWKGVCKSYNQTVQNWPKVSLNSKSIHLQNEWINNWPVHHNTSPDGMCHTAEFWLFLSSSPDIVHWPREGQGQPISDLCGNSIRLHFTEFIIFICKSPTKSKQTTSSSLPYIRTIANLHKREQGQVHIYGGTSIYKYRASIYLGI